MFRKCTISLIMFVVIIADCYAQETLDVKLRLQPDQKHTFRLTKELERISPVAAGQYKESFLEVQELSFEVIEVQEEGIASVKVTYGPYSTMVDRGGKKYKYNSTKLPKTDDVEWVVPKEAYIVGQSFILTLTPQGEIGHFEELEQFHVAAAKNWLAEDEKRMNKKYKQIMIKRSFGSRENWAASYKERAAKYFSQDRITDVLKYTLLDFPDQPIKIGDSWNGVIKVWGDHQIESKYMLKQRKDGVLMLSVSAKSGLKEAPFSSSSGDGAYFKVVGSSSGELEIDEATGWLIHSKITNSFKGKTIKKPPAENMKDAIQEKRTITVEQICIELVGIEQS